ncbi:hypothetical protein T23_17480 [Turicibacter faecis]|uniref:GGDEF domain-containing protein n=1 Tax=Turicibacter faecis TaxID=2963365 RepID=A0ABM8IK65_9FIRM|nr:hypothetical protein T23_17480 [Turicibacter sp. TC023]
MRGKSRWLKILSVLVIVAILVASVLRGKVFFSESDEFIEKILSGESQNFSEEQLATYEIDINKELTHLKSRKDLEKIYFALGKIAALQGNYESSTNYLLNAASFITGRHQPIDALIYETLATNYLVLDDVENGYLYFEEANNVIFQLKNSPLAISFYQQFAKGLTEYTDHTTFPIYLLSEAIQLTRDEEQKVILMKQLAEVYDINGLKDLAVSELTRALNMSVSLHNKELQLQLMNHLIRFYFGAHQYEETEEMLKNYFSIASDDPKENYDMLWHWLQVQYFLHGYEGFENGLSKLAKKYPEVVEEEKEYIEWFIAFNRAYFLMLEGKYEESEAYLKEAELIKNRENVSPVVSELIEMVRLDLSYRTKASDINFTERYQQLLAKMYFTPDTSGIMHHVMPQILARLLELGDYETVYQYTSRLRDPLDQELDAINALRDMIQKSAQREMQFNTSFSRVVIKYGGYVMATLFGIGLAYGAYRYNVYLATLKKRVKDSGKTDTLTRTLTKKALYEQLESEMDPDKNYYFLLMDINDFKLYNQDFGYLAGDRVLVEISHLLKEVFPDAAISRHSGHHFIIVLKDVEEHAVIEKVTFILEAIKQSQTISAKREITCCVGISKGHIKNTIDIDEYINLATIKLNISKQRGKGIYTL